MRPITSIDTRLPVPRRGRIDWIRSCVARDSGPGAGLGVDLAGRFGGGPGKGMPTLRERREDSRPFAQGLVRLLKVRVQHSNQTIAVETAEPLSNFPAGCHVE